MAEPLSELRFEYKEDLPSESYQCYQVMDGSIFYLSNSSPAQLFVISNDGTIIKGDASVLDDLDYLEIQIRANALCLSMLDHRDKEKEFSYSEQVESFPFSPHTFKVKDDTLLVRGLHQSNDDNPIKKIRLPCATEEVHKVFFKNSLFLIRNSNKVEFTKKSGDIVDIQMPFDVLRDKLNVHCYIDSKMLYIVNIGQDFLLKINVTADYISYRKIPFNRPSSCPFTTFDYSVGVRDDILTLRFFDENTRKAALWTAKIA